MSEALKSLLLKNLRVSTKDPEEGDDVGQPPTVAEVDEFVPLVPPIIERALNAALIDQISDALANEAVAVVGGRPRNRDFKKSKLYATIKACSPKQRGEFLANIAIASVAMDVPGSHWIFYNFSLNWWMRELYRGITKLDFELGLDQFRAILMSDRKEDGFSFTFTEALNKQLCKNANQYSFDNDDLAELSDLLDQQSTHTYHASTREALQVLKKIVGSRQLALWEGEAWARTLNEWLGNLDRNQLQIHIALLEHAGTSSLSKPSKQWISTAKNIVQESLSDHFASTLKSWLDIFLQQSRDSEPQEPRPYEESAYDEYAARHGAYQSNTAHIVGMIHLAQANWHSPFTSICANIAEHIAQMKGATRDANLHIGAAAIRALASRNEDEALAELTKLELRIRWPKLKKVVKKELENVIKRRKLDRAEIEESLVPDFGLRDGVATIPFDGVSAIIKLGKPDKPTLDWKLDDGKVTKIFPKSLASKNPDAKAQATAVVSDIEKMRAAQRTRLDLIMRRPRSWAFDIWRQRYLDHGLVGSLARRLIWIVDDVPVIWKDGELVDVKGESNSFQSDSTVRMWHAAERGVDEVVAWRNAIEAWEIAQPFKQAHREIYLLTDAERRTNTYSNRFAAHIVKAMTLLSISQVRQWKSGLYGGASSPSFELADHGLIAQWWMEAAGDDHTPFGTPLYLSTDQVRFVRVGDDQTPIPLDQIPVLAFSEIMRDIDLFVALSSVGNDPNWNDGGPGGQFRNYWQSYSFGDLTENAKTRRAALERLLPRLNIRDQASLTDKFLIIQGAIRKYKIHLGSGNILMEPNDQYLCIVADRSARSTGVNDVFLPFEGDAMLSIILSKAFLLADDKAITDTTITAQIRR